MMRYLRGRFHRHRADIEPLKFTSRREAKDWCAEQPGSPIKEIGADPATKRATKWRGMTALKLRPTGPWLSDR
jgi:hypothetical protein